MRMVLPIFSAAVLRVRRSIVARAKAGCAVNGQKTEGFSVAELMIVVAIISILILIAVVSYKVAIDRAQAATCASSRVAMTRAVELYFAQVGSYPTSIDDLQPYVSNWNSASKCPSGPALTYDTVTHDVLCPIHSP
jgi:general secretion pathway protein G